jgi:ATP-dependent DNA helicase RecG
MVDYRNPLLAEAMKVLGLVQRFGVGIATARALLQQNGNPPLAFDVQPTHVRCTVRRR